MDYGYDLIHAIPTKYRGVQFRSRLEAKWAAMFDMLGWKWEYEPFDLNGWIPDFALVNDTEILIETKPVREFPQQEVENITRSGLPREVLILGLNCLIYDSRGGCGPFRGPGFGWLGDAGYTVEPFDDISELEPDSRYPIYEEGELFVKADSKEGLAIQRTEIWPPAAFVQYVDGRFGFMPDGGYWQDYIHGHHGHDEHRLFKEKVDTELIENMWKKAANIVQWKAPYR